MITLRKLGKLKSLISPLGAKYELSYDQSFSISRLLAIELYSQILHLTKKQDFEVHPFSVERALDNWEALLGVKISLKVHKLKRL